MPARKVRCRRPRCGKKSRGLERRRCFGAVLGTQVGEGVLIGRSAAEHHGHHGNDGGQREHPGQQHARRRIEFGVAFASVSERLEDWFHGLDPHPHDFVVGVDQLVAHAHGQAHGHIGLLQRQGHFVDVAGAAGDGGGLGVGRGLQLVDLADGLAEFAAELSRFVRAAGLTMARSRRSSWPMRLRLRSRPGRCRCAGSWGYFVMSRPRVAICLRVSTAVALASKAREAESKLTISLMGLTLGNVTKPSASASGWLGL
jgi:hypothetical protein